MCAGAGRHERDAQDVLSRVGAGVYTQDAREGRAGAGVYTQYKNGA